MIQRIPILMIVLFVADMTTAVAQNPLVEFKCGTTSEENTTVAPGKDDGKWITAHGTLRILVVFARFPDDDNNTPNYWPSDGFPDLANNAGADAFVDGSASLESDHFNNLTNYFRQMSNDKFTVLGDVVTTTAPKSADQYDSRYEANKDILTSLDSEVDFAEYDKWKNTGSFKNSNHADGKVDMIAMIWRGFHEELLAVDGEAGLAINSDSLELDGVTIGFNFTTGSGFTVQTRTDNKQTMFQTTAHELAHWLVGGNHPYDNGPKHRVWSMLQGPGLRAQMANTFERDLLGWIDVKEITGDLTNQTLGDFLTDTTQMYSAYKYHPDNGNNDFGKEFFYIENHQQVSQYDDATHNVSDNGIFVLHHFSERNNGYLNVSNFSTDFHSIRHLSSDGDYVWINEDSTMNPYGSEPAFLPVFEKGVPDALNGQNYGTKMSVNPDSSMRLLAFKNEQDEILTGAHDQGGLFVGSFNPTQEPIFSDLTNPRADTWSKEETGFAVKVKDQNGTNLTVDFLTGHDPYVIDEEVKWAGPVSLNRDVHIKSGGHLIIGNHGSSKEFHVTIPESVTITVESGGIFEMEAGGGIGSRTYFTNKGTFNSQANSQFIMGDNTWYFNEGDADIDVSPELGTGSEIFGLDGQMKFTKAVNLSNPESCIAVDGGTVHFQQEASFSNGAFLMSFNSGGTFVADQSITANGGGNDNGYAIDLTAGTIFEMGFNERITVEEGASMRALGTAANPIRFTYQYPEEWPDGAWDEIRLRGDGNRFEHVVFEYGLEGLNIRSRDNVITHSTFKNNDTGIFSTVESSGDRTQFKLVDSKVSGNSGNGVVVQHADVAIEYSELSGNGQSGLYVRSATVGDNDFSGGLFRGNDIHGNGVYGIHLKDNATVWDGRSSAEGNNAINSNASHEVYLGSSGARWFDASGGGHSWIDDNDNNKYIYNLAQSFDGENYVSWTVPAENNYWGSSSGPSSDDFFGPVDYSPYLSSAPFGNAGPRDPGTPSEARTEGPTVVASVMSAGQARSYTAQSSSPEAAQQRLWIEQRMLELKNAIAKDPREKEVARRLNGLYYLWRQLPESARGQKQYVQETIRRYSDALWQAGPEPTPPSSAATGGSVSNTDRSGTDTDDATSLTGQTAMILEINHRLLEGQTQQAGEMIAEYRPYLTNLDMRRELLLARLTAYEQQGDYGQALEVVGQLQELGQLGIDPENAGQEYSQLKASLKAALDESTGGESEAGKRQQTSSTAGANPAGSPSLEQTTDELPQSFTLSPAFPNPFNPSTQLPFALPEAAEIRVEVYSITGRLVAVLANGRFDAGRHTLAFNAAGLASGVYLVRARLGEKIQTRKITLVK